MALSLPPSGGFSRFGFSHGAWFPGSSRTSRSPLKGAKRIISATPPTRPARAALHRPAASPENRAEEQLGHRAKARSAAPFHGAPNRPRGRPPLPLTRAPPALPRAPLAPPRAPPVA